MKKLLILAFVGLFSTQVQSATSTVNGIRYECNGSMMVINGEFWCNGVKMSPGNGSNSSFVQGSGVAKTKYIPTKGVRHASLSTSGDLYIEQCKNPLNCEEGLTMTADDNILDLLEAARYRDELDLTTKQNASFSTNTPIKYHLTVKDLNSVSTSGSGNITTSPITTAGTFTIKASGSGNITLKDIVAKKLNIKKSGGSNVKATIHTDKLDVVNSGSGNTTLDGTTKDQTISLSGSGTCDASNLESNRVDLSVLGSGSVHVDAKESIQGKISGSGSGTYSRAHSPTKVDVRTSGSGTFRKAYW